MHAEQVTDPVAYHGEGPVWSPSWGGLRWVDMLAGDVLSLAEDGSVDRRHVSDVVAAIRPRRAGGAVLGIERGFALEDADGELTLLSPVWDDERIRMNDGGCDPDGRFYCGSMAYDQRPGAATLHRLDPDGTTTAVVGGVTVSNGLDWSPDGSRAYYVDTATHRIDVFDYDRDRGLHGRRTFAEVPDGGLPDGLTVDEHGGIWVALADRGEVWHFSAAGVHDEVVEVPVGMVTACTFGGADLDQLFITTSRENLPPGADPLAGSLFRAAVGVRGLPVREFGG
ncbi:SMP-30/gluconolactonase/LRE family protein [Candidatus Blastococcus massiliensis]|uniref:SMP-30/gluconolactonase/LRE family protein n=1 Tax=Candidatus Blastococcus massiliensis TaxID=1470358 RepID=UPI0004B94BCF|nr:SMP-30/gluconolactonase/LRE family protein [Candidatus Blastococcus massiliensis]